MIQQECVVKGPKGKPQRPKHRKLFQVKPGQFVCFQDVWRRVSHIEHVENGLVRVTFGSRLNPEFTTRPISGALVLRFTKRLPKEQDNESQSGSR